MRRAEMLKRLDTLGRRFQTETTKITIAVNVIHILEEGDPRIGTWEELDTPAGFVKSTAFYARSVGHFNQMVDDHAAQETQ